MEGAIAHRQLQMGQAGEQLGDLTATLEIFEQKLTFVAENEETLRGELQGHQFEFTQLKKVSKEASRQIGTAARQL